ncbi:hypothetical protein JCM14469_21630 [Desulfatiferula olefinivorans]
MTLVSRIRLSSAELVLDLLQDRKLPAGFRDNQLIEAKVVEVLPQGRAQLRIDGRQVDVKTHVPLTEHDTLILKVVRQGDEQVLKLVEAQRPVTQAPGLSDMRSLGIQGPHGILARLLNSPPAGLTRHDPPAPMPSPGPAETATDSPVHQGGPHPAGNAPQTTPPPLVLKTAARPVPEPILTLSGTRTIPPELTLSMMLTLDRSRPPLPEPLVNALLARLNTLTARAPAATDTPAVPTTPMARLEQRALALFDALPSKDRNLLMQALREPTLPLSEKIRRIFPPRPDTPPMDRTFSELKSAVLKVLTNHPRIPADITPSPGAPLPSTPSLSPESNTPADTGMVNRLRHLIRTMALTDDKPFEPAALMRLVKNSGLMWEAKIRSFTESLTSGPEKPGAEPTPLPRVTDDVKALSMKLADSLESGGRDTAETLRRFVDSLDKMQILNSHSADDAGRYLLPLPFFSGQSLSFGQLFIDLDRRPEKPGKPGDRMIRVAFLLDMSVLGHVQADFAIFRKSLGGEFIVETPQAKEELDRALPDCVADLTRKGYTVTRMECRLAEPGALTGQSLAERMVDRGDGAVNILI